MLTEGAPRGLNLALGILLAFSSCSDGGSPSSSEAATPTASNIHSTSTSIVRSTSNGCPVIVLPESDGWEVFDSTVVDVGINESFYNPTTGSFAHALSNVFGEALSWAMVEYERLVVKEIHVTLYAAGDNRVAVFDLARLREDCELNYHLSSTSYQHEEAGFRGLVVKTGERLAGDASASSSQP